MNRDREDLAVKSTFDSQKQIYWQLRKHVPIKPESKQDIDIFFIVYTSMNIDFCRYLLQIKSKYGSEAELLIEELLQQAASTATGLLLAIANKYKDDKVGMQ